MSLNSIAVSFLLGLSGLLGVRELPDAAGTGWRVESAWTSEHGVEVLRAASREAVEACRQQPEAHILFPTVIHGAHEAYLDGKLIASFGDPTFERVRSFFGTLQVPCAEVAGGHELHWVAYSYTRYFARIHEFPRLKSGPLAANLFSESLATIAYGSLLIMGLFTLVTFWGKVSHGLTLSVALTNFFLSFYFFAGTCGQNGVAMPMLLAHKIADFGLLLGTTFFFRSLMHIGLIGRRLFAATVVQVGAALVLIAFARTGDSIQFGTTLAFGIALANIFASLHELSRNVLATNLNRLAVFQFLSVLIYLGVIVKDILAVLGLTNSEMFLPLGLVGCLLFFAFSINEFINRTYRERDYLRANLQNEVDRKTEELRNKTTDLESAMRKLQATQAELVHSAKLASLGTLSAGIAHEINNSLNYVYGSLQPLRKLVEAGIEEERKPKAVKLLDVMNDGLKLTFEIIKSLRNYTGLNQAKFNDLKLHDAISSVLVILKNKLRDKIEVSLEIPAELTISGSVVALNQIFMNLVTNAIDAMPGGGKLRISAVVSGPTVEIRVADSGVGIPAEALARIFDPFFTTKEVGKGTGLGLFIIKNEVERHQGTISVESTSGKGTTFTIRLPSRAIAASDREGMAA